MILVPFPLHFAENRRIDPAEVLEFVYDERKGVSAGILHYPLEDVPEAGLLSRKEHAELGFDFAADRIAQFLFGATSDEEIQEEVNAVRNGK